jgi:hypothetical protein
VDSNWSSDTNWSTTASSGPNNTTHAVAGDAVILDSGSPSCIISSVAACDSIVCTGYTATLTFNATLTIGGTPGTVTFASGMTIAGTSDLICTTTGTLTAGTKTLTGGLQFKGTSQTYTLADAWVVNGLLTTSGTTAITINGGSLSVGGGFTVVTATNGTTVITLTGGTWQGNIYLDNSLTLAGNVDIYQIVRVRNGTLTRASGTITFSGGSQVLNIYGSETLNTAGMTWPSIGLQSALTLTINSLLTATVLDTGGVAQTFAGTAGFTVGTLQNTSSLGANRTITLTQGNTYTVTNALTFRGLDATKVYTLASSHATLLATFIFSGSTQTVDYVKTTRIDSSGGNLIIDPNWVDNDPTHPTLNWATSAPGGTAPTMWLFS